MLDVYWKLNTAERNQPRKFLECVEENFPTQVPNEPSRDGALLDLLFMNKAGLVAAVVIL